MDWSMNTWISEGHEEAPDLINTIIWGLPDLLGLHSESSCGRCSPSPHVFPDPISCHLYATWSYKRCNLLPSACLWHLVFVLFAPCVLSIYCSVCVLWTRTWKLHQIWTVAVCGGWTWNKEIKIEMQSWRSPGWIKLSERPPKTSPSEANGLKTGVQWKDCGLKWAKRISTTLTTRTTRPHRANKHLSNTAETNREL